MANIRKTDKNVDQYLSQKELEEQGFTILESFKEDIKEKQQNDFKTVETITQWNGKKIPSKFTNLRAFRNNSYNQYIKSRQKKFKFFDDQISKGETTSSKQLERYKIWREQI